MPIFEASISFIDAFNRKATRSYKIDAVDFAAAQTVAGDLATDTSGIVFVGVVRYRVWQDTDFPTVVSPLSNVDGGGQFTWELNPLGGGKLASTQLPGINTNIYDENGALELGDPDVVNYRANFVGGAVRISDGETVADLKKGKLDK